MSATSAYRHVPPRLTSPAIFNLNTRKLYKSLPIMTAKLKERFQKSQNDFEDGHLLPVCIFDKYTYTHI